MISWTEQAAARAVELAKQIAPVAKTTLEVEAAAHLTYLAGILRGLAPHSEHDRRREPVTMERINAAVERDHAQREALMYRVQRDELLSAARAVVSDPAVPANVVKLERALARIEKG